MSFPYPMNPYDREREILRAEYDADAISYAEYLAGLDALDQQEAADEQDAFLAAERREMESLWAEEDDES